MSGQGSGAWCHSEWTKKATACSALCSVSSLLMTAAHITLPTREACTTGAAGGGSSLVLHEPVGILVVVTSLCELGQGEPSPKTQTSSGCAGRAFLSSQDGCTPDGPPHQYSWGVGSRPPQRCLLELWALSLETSAGLNISGCSWATSVPIYGGKPRTTCHSRLGVTRTENKEQLRARRVHHVTSDRKGLISAASNVLTLFSVTKQSPRLF